MLTPDKLEKSPLRVCIGHDDVRLYPLAARQFDATCAVAGYHDPRHVRIRPQRGAVISRCRRQCLRQPAHAASNVTSTPLHACRPAE